MKIAIIGAGISGLLAAYLLKKKRPDASITIFEKNTRVGGNVQTVQFNIGNSHHSSTLRWADLGVNDFNLATYKNILALLKELKVPYKPLENSAAFSTLDGSISYVIEPGYQAGSRAFTTMPVEVQKGFDNFSRQAPLDCQDPTFTEFSVAEYIQYRNENNPDHDPNFYPAAFVEYNLYPRINGMYFVNDTAPSTMSFVAIMNHYCLQEGFGGDSPERVYIEGGCQTWIDALQHALIQQGVSIVCNAAVQVLGDTSGVNILLNHSEFEHFDAAIMACHASTSLQLIQQGITSDMVQVLSQFSYNNSVAIAHTYAPLLPPNQAHWRTYNLLIHRDVQLRPYTISYVCNRHQNDANHHLYQAASEEYFVTLNPAIPIPEEYVLKQFDGTPAQTYFKHNMVNAKALKAQKLLWGRHRRGVQGQNSIYFTGGWTWGTGLHEDCYHSAQQVVNLLLVHLLEPEWNTLELSKLSA
ncbi:FAD-dependent oxidoreductase [Acaryochloris sp. IP29b_bin.148]|uniref:FAD-dependent oxidoreductase n=1 Tax=Acaryochloris sp. IP29b_bin.148 TaxID=2969218 RepID=UPI002609F015|nr:FAD-dependent oxidoreductase [Acaryochloris sp. IP29b_bin.148]